MLRSRFAAVVAEIDRERRDDEEMIFLGDAAGLRVVFRDGRVFVAQIHLDDLFHVLVQLGELFLELRRLRPDAAVDGGLLVIRQVHQRGEILAEADRIENGEAQLARRRGGQQPENDVVDGRHRLGLAALGRLKKNRAFERIRQRQRHGKSRRAGQRQPFVFRHRLGQRGQIHFQPREFRGVFEFPRRRPVFPFGRIPFGEKLFRAGVRGADLVVKRLDGVLPFGFERQPLRLKIGFELCLFRGEHFGKFSGVRFGFLAQAGRGWRRGPFRVVRAWRGEAVRIFDRRAAPVHPELTGLAPRNSIAPRTA